jgi:acyl carrier protein
LQRADPDVIFGEQAFIPTTACKNDAIAFTQRTGRGLMSSLEKLQAAFVSAIGVPATADFGKLAYGQTSGWDSIAHLTLINEIESNFDIMLDTGDVIGMSSFVKAKEILSKYGVVLA